MYLVFPIIKFLNFFLSESRPQAGGKGKHLNKKHNQVQNTIQVRCETTSR